MLFCFFIDDTILCIFFYYFLPTTNCEFFLYLWQILLRTTYLGHCCCLPLEVWFIYAELNRNQTATYIVYTVKIFKNLKFWYALIVYVDIMLTCTLTRGLFHVKDWLSIEDIKFIWDKYILRYLAFRDLIFCMLILSSISDLVRLWTMLANSF